MEPSEAVEVPFEKGPKGPKGDLGGFAFGRGVKSPLPTFCIGGYTTGGYKNGDGISRRHFIVT
jgi:hypothetical protein